MASSRRVVLWCAVVHGVLLRRALLTRIGAKISGAKKCPRLTLTDLEDGFYSYKYGFRATDGRQGLELF
jgi:hypothetical protein